MSTDPNFADLPRVCAWFVEDPATRKPAHMAFTEGPERDLATLMERIVADGDEIREIAEGIVQKYGKPSLRLSIQDEEGAEKAMVAMGFSYEEWDKKSWKKAVQAVLAAANAPAKERYVFLRQGWPKSKEYDEVVREAVEDLNIFLESENA